MLTLNKVSMGFGGPPLLNEVTVEIHPMERICVVGRNGTGKSTMMKVISGEIKPDSGDVWRSPQARIAVLPQEVPVGVHGTVTEVVLQGLEGLDVEHWDADMRLDRTLGAMGLDGEAEFSALSAGMRRRVWLARCVIGEPALLLLDEPTNHLDIDSIAWLEEFLRIFPGALLFVTHDRAFLQRVATRILDLDRGQLMSWDCDYETYIKRKEDWLANEARQNALFDKRLSQEETWIRQGVKARRTRNEGRVRALKKMREEHQARRQKVGSVRLEIEEANRSGVKVIAAEDASFSYGDKVIIKEFSALIARNDKIGIVGPNGAGKTTLIKLLLGSLAPTGGKVLQGTNLQVAYFDQLRDKLNEQSTVKDSIADGNEFVEINGRKTHVISYLQDFLFAPDRARSTVNMLSGGERNRLLLARLFTRPFNLLVMDEPTNDLDMETLELLEELLANYQGTLLLVSHDRAFLDNVVTDLLVLEGGGVVRSFVGGYADYLEVRKREVNAVRERARLAEEKAKPATAPKSTEKPRKFTNRERQELESLPAELEKLEKDLQTEMAKMVDPVFYQKGGAAVKETEKKIHAMEKTLHDKFSRWEELEKLQRQGEGG
ncbi:MAG: ATP-binding cassette domain-containing protein [Verrucomicrobiota bacterium]|nr:ATP-binding cassette domain-containing protein [Verrucomicrobiota bacterium]